MKVIYPTDNYWPRVSGMAVSIDSFRFELAKHDYAIHVFAPNYPGSEDLDLKMQYKYVHRFRSGKVFFSKDDRLVKFSEKKHVNKILDELKPDICHIQTEFTMGRLVTKYAETHRLPLVMTCHTYFEQYINHYMPFLPHGQARRFARNFTRKFYNRADVVIAPTIFMKEVLESYGVDTPIEVIPTGIPADEFAGLSKDNEKQNSRWFKEYPELKGKKLLLHAGRIGQEKNVDFLIQMLEQVVRQIPDVILMFAGDGPDREKLQQSIDELGLHKNVVFFGFVDRNRMKELYHLADIFVFASKTETQGLVTAEAMICHTPVVAIGKMGTRQIMNGDNGGYMVEEDVDEFASKVLLLLKDSKLYHAKSEEAYRYAQNWTIEVMAKKMVKIYERVLSGKDN